jgi:hypothetical protein
MEPVPLAVVEGDYGTVFSRHRSTIGPQLSKSLPSGRYRTDRVALRKEKRRCFQRLSKWAVLGSNQ